MSKKRPPRPRRQCAKCPWKVSTNPHDIPNGYSPEKHAALARTIADQNRFDPETLSGELHIMTCHETHSLACVGWLANQLGPGNNIPLRISARGGRFGEFELDGEQHERFEDTLPTTENRQ